jgi:UDP-N-acetylglucosamine 2-epimerase (non-hydrolysing)
MSECPLADAPPRIGIVLGTRPEVIKLFPLIRALQPFVEAGNVAVEVLSTGQQRELLDQVLGWLGVVPDCDLQAMNSNDPGENPALLHARLVTEISHWLRDRQIDRCVVQGDTSSAHAGALAAHYLRVPVSHVEAGLRTWDTRQPFPEEMHRQAIAIVADQHFCPTPRALQNLRTANINTTNAWMVGNTVVDAVRLCRARVEPPRDLPEKRDFRLYVTVHRRENHDRLQSAILPAIARVVADNQNLDAVVSVHPNPAVRAAVQQTLSGVERVHLRLPLDYGASLAMVRDATLVVTDSGGLQEEAAALGTPVVVLRQLTERQEAIEYGHAIMPGTGAVQIAHTLHGLLQDPVTRAAMSRPSAAFGDGYAAQRIAARIVDSLVARAQKGVA